MFLFQQGSRNQADAQSKFVDYQENILKLLKIRIADMDTVDKYLRFLDPCLLEEIKQQLVKELIKSKVLYKHRLLEKYFMIAIDGTGVHSYDYEPYKACPFKELRDGKKIWTTYVLEAKLVSLNGFALSIATEWIENPTDKDFDKQDSELKAFKRLAKKLKQSFPRLPIVLLLDGLYPNKSVFDICKENGWSYIISLKDKSLKSIQEVISEKNFFKDYKTETSLSAERRYWYIDNYKYFDNIEYQGHQLFVLETIAEKIHKKTGKKQQTRFVHITDLTINKSNVEQLSQAGRSRWKIENLGFKIQKQDYNLRHKYSRTNFRATKNYYQLLQIAHIINQLTYKLQSIRYYIKQYGLTTKWLMEKIFSILIGEALTDLELLNSLLAKKQQLRY